MNGKGQDLVGWFSTLMVRIALTDDEQERKELMDELVPITDELPYLRPYARKAGISKVLPDSHKAVNYEA